MRLYVPSGESSSAFSRTVTPQPFRQHSIAVCKPPTPAPMMTTLMPFSGYLLTPSIKDEVLVLESIIVTLQVDVRETASSVVELRPFFAEDYYRIFSRV